ncbi:hypothetical protein [Streptomyces sp. NPDC054865]
MSGLQTRVVSLGTPYIPQQLRPDRRAEPLCPDFEKDLVMLPFRTDLDASPSLPMRIYTFLVKATLVYLAAWAATDYARSKGLLATIHQPVAAFLREHTVDLAMSANDAIELWAVLGVGAFVMGAFSRSLPARMLWSGWGVVTTAMVWLGTTPPGRAIAVGVTILAWTAASVVALRRRG